MAEEVDTDYVKPKAMGKLKACLSCKLIKTDEEWNSGCENCGDMEEHGEPSRWTTANFTGMLAKMDDHQSWVCNISKLWVKKQDSMPSKCKANW